jgi:siroheme synthase
VLVGELGEIGALAETAAITGPAVFVVGEVVRHRLPPWDRGRLGRLSDPAQESLTPIRRATGPEQPAAETAAVPGENTAGVLT